MNTEHSKALFERAKKCMPGGVSSPVRAYKSVGGLPRFIERGEGAHIFDTDGNRYIDYVMSYGPLIFGHRPPVIIDAVKEASSKGTSFGAPTELEIQLAEQISDAFPFVELVRFVSSGTEATMSAVRVARAKTKRDYILKFEGCYHGHSDFFLVKAGSGGLTFNIPSSPGVPEGVSAYTLLAPYNDIESVKEIFRENGKDIAAVIVEPIAGNMGVIPPKEGFLEGLRELTENYDTLLIFDEVITGFRVEFGGVSTKTNIEPDLLTLGKIIGGGLPVGAFCGREEVMGLLAPEGDVYQAGTLSGNPLAMSAGISALKTLKEENPYPTLRKRTEKLVNSLKGIFKRKGISAVFNLETAMFSISFAEKKVENLSDVQSSSGEVYSKLFHLLLEEGVMLAPSPYEAIFLSTAHEDKVLNETIAAFERAVSKI